MISGSFLISSDMQRLRRIGLLVLLLHLSGYSPAQMPLQVEASYLDSLHAWHIPASVIHRYGSGASILSQSESDTKSIITRESLIRQRDDFILSTSLLFSSETLSWTSGIVWGANADRDEYYAFLIRPDGHFAVSQVSGEESAFLLPWTRTRKLKITDDPVLLTLERRGRKLYLSINEKEVADLLAPRMTGKYHGLALYGTISMEVNRFAIYRPDHQLLHATGSFYNATRRPLDSTINTRADETAPMLSPERQQLFFSRGAFPVLSQAELLQSFVQGDSMWGEPVSVFSAPIPGRTEVYRTREGELSLTLSPGTGSAGIGGANLSDSIWSAPQKTVVRAIGEQQGWITAYESADKDILVFSANRRGGYGNQDLYVLFKKNDGSYGGMKNLGPDINTFEDELAPWMSPDGKFLYFTSGGHPGYGGWDLYRSERLTQTWTRWSEPENLGPRINTRMDEAWYVPWKEDRAYIAARDSVRGDFDLYGLRLPLDPATLNVVRLRGQILNRKTGRPMAGQLNLRIIPDGMNSKKIDIEDGADGYHSLVTYGVAYELSGIVPGFFPLTDTLDLRAVEQYRDIRKDVYMVPIEVGETIRLDKVYFERASPELKEESYAELNRLAVLMESIPTLKIEIHGHTDDIGDRGELQILSESRAEQVMWYLIEHGIESTRMRALGFGGSLPVADNRNPKTRPLNRRVEFVIINR